MKNMKLNRFIKVIAPFILSVSSCNLMPKSEVKFFEIPDDHYNLLTDYAKSKIWTMPSRNNTRIKDMSSIVFLDSSMLPISEISFDDGLEMSIQAFHRNKFTFDSINTIKQYSKSNIGIISYSVLGSISDERLLCMESGDYIDHLTIRSIPESMVIKGENFLTIPLNDVKSFSYELNHSGIISFVINSDYEEGIFMMVLLERPEKVYIITFFNDESKEFDFSKILNIREDVLTDK
jgi:hypothetical protein